MSNTNTQKHKAEVLRKLHLSPPILVLPNAWDVASAVLFERAGAHAIATTSAGVANSLGYRDGQFAPLAAVLAVTAKIAATVNVPVSADLEAGYAGSAEKLRVVIGKLLEAGAVGVNLEDGLPQGSVQPLREIVEQQQRLRAARMAAEAAGIPLVVNARTDVYLHQVGEPSGRRAETLRRLHAYKEAGADCLFVPGVSDPVLIEDLVRELRMPVNILAGPSTPGVPELQKLGVAHVSVGSSLHHASLAFAERLAKGILAGGDFKPLISNLSYQELNALMTS